MARLHEACFRFVWLKTKVMNTKPSLKKYDRLLVLQFGLIISLSLTLLAFRWKSPLAQSPVLPKTDESMQMVDFESIVHPRSLPNPAPAHPRFNPTKIDFSDPAQASEEWPATTAAVGELPELPDEFIDTTDAFVAGAEVFPQFPGGMQALMSYLARNIRYNATAIEFRITGKVYISFVVLPNGSIDEVRVVKGLGFGLDEEAIRVVKAMPRWLPGTQNGQPVAVVYNLPIQFSLR